jgi:hypothetical protein
LYNYSFFWKGDNFFQYLPTHFLFFPVSIGLIAARWPWYVGNVCWELPKPTAYQSFSMSPFLRRPCSNFMGSNFQHYRRKPNISLGGLRRKSHGISCVRLAFSPNCKATFYSVFHVTETKSKLVNIFEQLLPIFWCQQDTIFVQYFVSNTYHVAYYILYILAFEIRSNYMFDHGGRWFLEL